MEGGNIHSVYGTGQLWLMKKNPNHADQGCVTRTKCKTARMNRGVVNGARPNLSEPTNMLSRKEEFMEINQV